MHTTRTLYAGSKWNVSPKPSPSWTGDSDASDPGTPVQDVRSVISGAGRKILTRTVLSIGLGTGLVLAGWDRAHSRADPVAVVRKQFDRWL